MFPGFSDRISVLQLTPGFPAKVVSDNLLPNIEGLVLVAFSSGTAPTNDPEFLKMLRNAKKQILPVILVTADAGSAGETDISLYPAGSALLREGCHWAGSMTVECAYVKAAWILAQDQGRVDL